MISTSHFHPMLVHFPIALVLFGFIFDAISLFFKKEPCLSKSGFYLLLVGTLSGIAAWLSGILFTSDLSGAAGEIKETHELLALLTVITLVITSALRIYLKVKNKENSNAKWLAFILYAVATLLVSATGFFGGTLVYSYMMPL
jgi:uncharacterized membrane protein